MRIYLFCSLFCSSMLGFCFSKPNESHDPIIVSEQMTVNLVELDVRVQSLGGNHSSGLNKNDFRVYENGELQDIVYFKEISSRNPNEDDPADHEQKYMVLLDFVNSPFREMRRVFDELRKNLEKDFNAQRPTGIAINASTIIEIVPFTKDKKALLQALDIAEDLYFGKSRKSGNPNKAVHDFRPMPRMSNRFGAQDAEAQKVQTSPYYDPLAKNNFLNNEYVHSAYNHQNKLISQFLNYLGTYSGKKNLIIITGPWGHQDNVSASEEFRNDWRASMKAIQTSCLYQKISINVLSFVPTEIQDLENNNDIQDRSIELAVQTSGIYRNPINGRIERIFQKTVDQSTHFYRVRYYSKNSQDKFCDIKVKVKGLNRIASAQKGYKPRNEEDERVLKPIDINLAKPRILTVKMKTDWLKWKDIKGGKKIGKYAIGCRLYDTDGNVVEERVYMDEVKSAKKTYPVLSFDVKISPEQQIKLMKMQTIMTDLLTGKQVVIDTLNSAPPT